PLENQLSVLQLVSPDVEIRVIPRIHPCLVYAVLLAEICEQLERVTAAPVFLASLRDDAAEDLIAPECALHHLAVVVDDLGWKPGLFHQLRKLLGLDFNDKPACCVAPSASTATSATSRTAATTGTGLRVGRNRKNQHQQCQHRLCHNAHVKFPPANTL